MDKSEQTFESKNDKSLLLPFSLRKLLYGFDYFARIPPSDDKSIGDGSPSER
jgi:hypothetical protein